MENIDRKKSLVLLSVVAIAAMLSGIVVTTYAANNDEASTAMPRLCGWQRRWRLKGGFFGSIEISEGFEANVINIAEKDPNVQKLLTDGYNIVGVRPIIKLIVESNGDISTKATEALVKLKTEDATGHAAVWVDLNAGIVTKIVTVTRTVIEKT